MSCEDCILSEPYTVFDGDEEVWVLYCRFVVDYVDPEDWCPWVSEEQEQARR